MEYGLPNYARMLLGDEWDPVLGPTNNSYGLYNSSTKDYVNGNNAFGFWGRYTPWMAGLKGISDIANIGLGLYGIASARKQNRLANRALNAEIAFQNRNIANQAKTINNIYDAATAIGSVAGNSYVDGNGLVRRPSESVITADLEKGKQRYVNGDPIAV